jgi:two-component response regulator (ARR-B family)
MASLPLQAGYPGGSLADVHSQGMIFTNSPEYINGNLPFQGWEDRNQDAAYRSNVTCGSINSLAPVNGAVVPPGQTTTNSTLHRNLDTKFCDPIQMKHAGFADLSECSSSRQPRVNILSQQKFSNNLGSLEYLASSMMEQVITFLKYNVAFPIDFLYDFFNILITANSHMLNGFKLKF